MKCKKTHLVNYFQKHSEHFALPEATVGADTSNPKKRLRVQCIRNHNEWRYLKYNHQIIRSHLIDDQLDTSKLSQFVEKSKTNTFRKNIN